MRRATLFLSIILLAAACGSTTLGGLGSILGSPSPSQPSAVTGVVSGVDTERAAH